MSDPVIIKIMVSTLACHWPMVLMQERFARENHTDPSSVKNDHGFGVIGAGHDRLMLRRLTGVNG
jgi:hypothetical protein